MRSRQTCSWFRVDKAGLARLVDHRGKIVLLHELLSNAWDTRATEARITVSHANGTATLTIADDDPDGFLDLTHAYTLWAPSSRANDPERRGRFNLGEKMALALCKSAKIQTTSGTVTFSASGDMRISKERLPKGTVFTACVPMTRPEYQAMMEGIKILIPPIPTFINGEKLPDREPVARFSTTLYTVIADSQGVLRFRDRKTSVEVFEPKDGETPMLFEMGIPVVEWDRFHVNVTQKVPLGVERNNVLPSFRRALRTAILNHCSDLLEGEDITSQWVTEALESPRVDSEAVKEIVTRRFGEEAVAFDPSDIEASHRATAEGWKVVHGNTFSKEIWENIRKAGALPPAGRKFPTPRPYSDDPDAPPVEVIPPDQWTRGMIEIAEISRALGKGANVASEIHVRFVKMSRQFRACWTRKGRLDFNVACLGSRWFEQWREHPDDVLALLIHEFAHEVEPNHLSERYHRACCKFGARIAILLAKRDGTIPHWN